MGRLHPREEQAVELLPGVLPPQVGEFGETAQIVLLAVPVFDPLGSVGSKGFEEVGFGLDRFLNGRPDLADRRFSMGVGRSEYPHFDCIGQFEGDSVVTGEMFWIIDFYGVDLGFVLQEIFTIQAHGQKLGMGCQDDRVLAIEFAHCRFEGDEIRNWLVEPQCEDVFPVLPGSREYLPGRNDEQVFVAQAFGSPTGGREAGEMWGVNQHVDAAGFRPVDDLLVEDFDVEVDTRFRHSRDWVAPVLSLVDPPRPNWIAAGRVAAAVGNRYGRATQITGMSRWVCAIEGCLADFEDVESVLSHQRDDHEGHTCRVCGESVSAGFFAIKHAFTEHTRAEYVRHYDADSDAIRWREKITESVEDTLDTESAESASD